MNIRTIITAVCAGSMLLASCGTSTPKQQPGEKARVFITCDPELDDNNSLIRYILFSDNFETEGIVLTSSKFHWKNDGSGKTQYRETSEYAAMGLGPQTEWRWGDGDSMIVRLLEDYEACYPNLKVHSAEYPTPEFMWSKYKVGNIYFEGDYSYDSEGAQLLEEVLMKDDPRPIFVQAWGGSSTIARALYNIEQKYKGTDRWDSIYKMITDKMYICGGDQDGCLTGYIQENWPDYKRPGQGGVPMPIAYNGQRSLPDEYVYYFEPEWVSENLRIGPFGEHQRVWGDGKQFCPGDKWDYFGIAGKTAEELVEEGYVVWSALEKPGSFLAEGDSGCFLNQIDNGLRAWQDPTWGGWGGRRDPKASAPRRAMSFGAVNIEGMRSRGLNGRPRVPYKKSELFPDFFPEAMNSLAVRFHWSVNPDYASCNHYPVVNGPLELSAAPGEKVTIKAVAADPDGDGLSIKWMQFKVGTYEGDVAVDNPSTAKTTFTVPADAKSGETIHLVLQAADNGTPSLIRYLRTVITVK